MSEEMPKFIDTYKHGVIRPIIEVHYLEDQDGFCFPSGDSQ